MYASAASLPSLGRPTPSAGNLTPAAPLRRSPQLGTQSVPNAVPRRPSSQGPPVKAAVEVAPAVPSYGLQAVETASPYALPAQTQPVPPLSQSQALSQLPQPEVVVLSGVQLPILTEIHLRTLHPMKLREHAAQLVRTLGVERLGIPVPQSDLELVAWISQVQRLHLEPLRETAVKPQNGLAYTNGSQSARSLQVPPQVRALGEAQQVISTPAPGPTISDSQLQVEVYRRQAAEARVRELEALVTRLRQRISSLEGKRTSGPEPRRGEEVMDSTNEDMIIDDPIDRAICEYLERNPDFPVSIQKVAPNYYVFGDRGTVYVTQRGEHIVVRVGGGFKSLQVFMDERALMVTREAATALSEKILLDGQLG